MGKDAYSNMIKDNKGKIINFPIIKTNNFGHIDKKMVIPIGVKAEINTDEKIKIKLLEGCCK